MDEPTSAINDPLPDEPTASSSPEDHRAGSSADLPPPDLLSGVLSDPALMAKLPQIVAMLKPLLAGALPSSGAASSGSSPSGTPSAEDLRADPIDGSDRQPPPVPPSPEKSPEDCRNDLLLALRPFLSPERARAVDTILRLNRLGGILRQMQ